MTGNNEKPSKGTSKYNKLEKAISLGILITFFGVIIFFALFGDDESHRAALAILMSIFSP